MIRFKFASLIKKIPSYSLPLKLTAHLVFKNKRFKIFIP